MQRHDRRHQPAGTGDGQHVLDEHQVGLLAGSGEPELQTLEQAGADLELIEWPTRREAVSPRSTWTPRPPGRVRHGRRLDGLTLPAEVTALFGRGEFLALHRRAGAGAVPEAVFVG